MKKQTHKRFTGIIFAVMLGFPATLISQTQGSGAMPNLLFPPAGTAGTSRTFVGGGAGENNTSGGDDNTFIGQDAGNNNVDSDENVFVGARAGYSNGIGDNQAKSSQNVFVGCDAGYSNGNGGNNTFVGFKSGYNNVSGLANSYYGVYAGLLGTGSGNSIFGFEAGYLNTSDDNSFFGKYSARSNTTGSYNSAFGTQALFSNGTGNYNTGMGYQAGLGSGSGSNSSNSFFGYRSGYSISTGGNNSFFGHQSGFALTTGGSNVFLGYEAGSSTSTGSNSIFIGYQAGNANTSGSNNTIIGYNSDAGSSGLTNASAFGANAIVRNSDHMILGDNNVHVGINLSNDATGPASVLSIGGNGNALYEVYGFNPSSGNGCVAIKGEIDASLTVNSVNKVYATIGVVNAYYGFSYGIYGSAYKTTAHQAGRAYGVYGVAGNCSNLHNYGVYGIVAGSNTGFAVYSDGLLRTTNDGPEKLTSGTWAGYSDERLKKDVEPFTDGLAVLRQIDLVTYKFNGIGGINDTTTQIGVIAQDVKDVVPYCVGTTQLAIKQEDGAAFASDIVTTINDSVPEYVVEVMSYDMTGLIYVMMNSIKELDSTVTALQNQVDEANQRVIGPDSAQNNLPVQQVTLSSQRAILYQNTPNPAGDETTINYYISEGAANAEMVFYDAYGKEIKRVALVNQGNASLAVNTQDLDAGIYSYSLIVDGKIIDTLKLVRVK